MSLPEYNQECYILDDEELAKADVAPKSEPEYEKRAWKMNESERMKNPFQKGYIKSANTFPPAFQYKTKSPPIRGERKSSVENISNMPTFSLLEKVKTILNEQPQYKEKIVETESRTPPYGPD